MHVKCGVDDCGAWGRDHRAIHTSIALLLKSLSPVCDAFDAIEGFDEYEIDAMVESYRGGVGSLEDIRRGVHLLRRGCGVLSVADGERDGE